MRIEPNNRKLQYCGRIDWENPTEPVFIFPCTSVKLKFTGHFLKVQVRNHSADLDNYLGCVLDGKMYAEKLPGEGEALLAFPVEEKEKEVHEALVYKRQDSCHEMTILGFEIEDGAKLLDLPAPSGRKIEVYGDSVSAGEVTEAVDFTGKTDPPNRGEYSNSWYSYAWMTARKLNARIHDIAQGGAALLDGTGWFLEPDAISMETIWDSLHYHPALGKPVKWKFEQYTPQVVIVAIGQNDNHPDDYMMENYESERSRFWRMSYQKFLQKLRAKYKEAEIICCTTILQHDESWDRAIGDAVRAMKDPHITHFLYRRNGKATPGHPRIPECEEMAEELAAYISGLPIKGWD